MDVRIPPPCPDECSMILTRQPDLPTGCLVTHVSQRHWQTLLSFKLQERQALMMMPKSSIARWMFHDGCNYARYRATGCFAPSLSQRYCQIPLLGTQAFRRTCWWWLSRRRPVPVPGWCRSSEVRTWFGWHGTWLGMLVWSSALCAPVYFCRFAELRCFHRPFFVL